MPYNLSSISGATNPLDLFSGLNTAAGGWVGFLTLLLLFCVVLIAMLRTNPPKESTLAASISTGIVALLFLYMGLVSVIWVVGFSLIAAAAGVGLYFEKN